MSFAIGLIGFGEIARNRHLPTIAANPAFRLVAVADPYADFAAAGVPGFHTHGEMFSAIGELDAVAICTPPSVRTRVALDAMAAGKHVLIEKPPTATIGEAFLLQETADQAGVVLFTAWHSQANAAVARTRALLAGETVKQLSMVWSENFEAYHPGQGWIWRPGGFGVLDAGINGLSILTDILPQRAIVTAADFVVRDGDDTPIAARLRFGFGNDAHASGEAVMDWRLRGDAVREITIGTASGRVVQLLDSGGRVVVDGRVELHAQRSEYADLYAMFGVLLRDRRSDVDFAPLMLAIDAMQLGRRVSAL